MAVNKFGYSVHADRQIDYDKSDHTVYERVVAREHSIDYCISCGTCAATCSAANFTDFSLRKIILMVRRGYIHPTLRAEAAKCMLCGKCQLVCPRGVSTRNVIIQINKALQ